MTEAAQAQRRSHVKPLCYGLYRKDSAECKIACVHFGACRQVRHERPRALCRDRIRELLAESGDMSAEEIMEAAGEVYYIGTVRDALYKMLEVGEIERFVKGDLRRRRYRIRARMPAGVSAA